MSDGKANSEEQDCHRIRRLVRYAEEMGFQL
jgi:hypothetical protein